MTEEDDINLFGVDDDSFEVHYDKKQGLYTPYDDKRDDNENYYQNMENAVIEPSKEYELRSKSNQQIPDNKTSDKPSQNSTATQSKTIKQKDKTVADNSGNGKEKDTQTIEKQSANISSINTSVSTPGKTTVSTVDKLNQQAVIADKAAANKAEINVLKSQNLFSLEQEI